MRRSDVGGAGPRWAVGRATMARLSP